MGIEFGTKLRNRRTARGLTHADLAAPGCPARYVALIEDGLREPTPAVIRELSARLQLTPAQLEAAEHPASPAEASYQRHSQTARQAHGLREYDSAVSHAAQAAAAAEQAGKEGARWDMTSLQAESLMKLRQFAQATALAQALLERPFGANDAFTARVHDMLARCALGQGRIRAAVENARHAVRTAATAEPRTAALLTSISTLVEALAEAEALEQAWSYCSTLADLAADEPDPRMRGIAQASISNVAFRRGDHLEGTAHHQRAGRDLSPADDICLWAEFSRASAAARIAGGHIELGTEHALKRAELAYSVIGGTRADHLELALLRARWLYAAGSPGQALPLLQDVHHEKHLLPHHQAALASRLLARALEAAGRPHEAEQAIKEAAGDLHAGRNVGAREGLSRMPSEPESARGSFSGACRLRAPGDV